MTTTLHRFIRFITASALGLGLLWSAPSRGAPPNTIANSVAVCDPWNPQSCSRLSGVTPTDCSGSIAVGGTAQNAFTASTTRQGFMIANIDTSEVLWISFTGTASPSGAGSYPLAPATVTTFAGLSTFVTPPGFSVGTALSVVGATGAHKYTCTTW